MHYYEKEVVCALLDMGGCIRLMRDVLIDYSAAAPSRRCGASCRSASESCWG